MIAFGMTPEGKPVPANMYVHTNQPPDPLKLYFLLL